MTGIYRRRRRRRSLGRRALKSAASGRRKCRPHKYKSRRLVRKGGKRIFRYKY